MAHRGTRAAIAAGSILLLAGCASFSGFPDRPVSGDAELRSLVDQYYSDALLKEYYDVSPTASDGEVIRHRVRNEIVNGRIAATDILFNRFQRELHKDGVATNIAADTAILGVGAAGAVTSQGASQILSATAGGITGLKSTVDRDLFFEKTMPALLAQMNAKRQSVLAKIRIGLSKSTAEYPLSQGLADLEAYYFAGSIPGAVVDITTEAGAAAAAAEAKLIGVLTEEAVSEKVITGVRSNIDAIASLTNEQALRLILIVDNLFPEIALPVGQSVNPTGSRYTDGAIAREVLRNITPAVNRTAKGVEKLTTAIESVKK